MRQHEHTPWQWQSSTRLKQSIVSKRVITFLLGITSSLSGLSITPKVYSQESIYARVSVFWSTRNFVLVEGKAAK